MLTTSFSETVITVGLGAPCRMGSTLHRSHWCSPNAAPGSSLRSPASSRTRAGCAGAGQRSKGSCCCRIGRRRPCTAASRLQSSACAPPRCHQGAAPACAGHLAFTGGGRRRQQKLADGRAFRNRETHRRERQRREIRGSWHPEARNVAGPGAATKRIYCWALTALCKQTSEEPGLCAVPVLNAQSTLEDVGRRSIK